MIRRTDTCVVITIACLALACSSRDGGDEGNSKATTKPDKVKKPKTGGGSKNEGAGQDKEGPSEGDAGKEGNGSSEADGSETGPCTDDSGDCVDEGDPVPVNQCPSVALASSHFETIVGETICIDGSQSNDPEDGEISGLLLLKSSGGSAPWKLEIDGTTICFETTETGQEELELMAFDSEGLLSCNRAAVVVNVAPKPGDGHRIRIEVTWTKAPTSYYGAEYADLDLHLLRRSTSTNGSEDDCYWENPEPEWFGTGNSGNPRSGPNTAYVSGSAQEWIEVESMAPSEGHEIGVDFRDANHYTPAYVLMEATVTVYSDDLWACSFTTPAMNELDWWQVALVRGDGTCEPIELLWGE